MIFDVNTHTDLLTLKSDYSILNRNTFEKVNINLKIDSRDDKEQRILRQFNECGCKAGSLSLVISFPVILITLTLLYGFSFRSMLYVFLGSIVISLFSKIVVLISSFNKLNFELNQLEKYFIN